MNMLLIDMKVQTEGPQGGFLLSFLSQFGYSLSSVCPAALLKSNASLCESFAVSVVLICCYFQKKCLCKQSCMEKKFHKKEGIFFSWLVSLERETEFIGNTKRELSQAIMKVGGLTFYDD